MIPAGSRVLVQSLTGSGAWVVDRPTFGSALVCDCPSFNIKKKGRCKHTDIVASASALVDRCNAVHGWNGGRLCLPCLVAFIVAARRKVERREKGMVQKTKRKARKSK